MKYKKSLFIFHRDFRLDDNRGLLECLDNTEKDVYLAFIFTYNQVSKNNTFFSEKSVYFMLKSLEELNDALAKLNKRISFFYGYSRKILKEILQSEHDIEAVWENKDFTPFAKQRQTQNKDMCEANGVDHYLVDDINIKEMGTFLTARGNCYKKFTPFYNNIINFLKKDPVEKPKKINPAILEKIVNKARAFPNEIELSDFIEKNTPRSINIPLLGEIPGRKHALTILKNIDDFSNYYIDKDYPYSDGGTRLSSHLHFGTISSREYFEAVAGMKNKKSSVLLISQLIWREFYMYIINYINTDYSKKSMTLPKMNNLEWVDLKIRENKEKLERWMKGKTGVPIVDAGMIQMNKTGYMHNRIRMIVAMYLIYYLEIHWIEGEKYFAQSLVDYSYSNNFGGWVWVSASEVHSNMYFRVFSMEGQSKKYDAEAKYIKKWIPELNDVPAKDIHNWEVNYINYPKIKYAEPIIKDLKAQRKKRIKEIRGTITF